MNQNSRSAPIILAIDTSCDDTSAAVTTGVTVWSNVIASQTELHRPYGGVFPTVAKQAHREQIDRVVEIALARAGVNWDDIQAIAVTQGPGLAPALEVGITKGKNLATAHGKPVIAVNHVEAHALSALAQPRSATNPQAYTGVSDALNRHQFPVLLLVVSGGHTEFILATKLGQYKKLGWTIDDATGEALDKVGRILGLGYPAGPIIEQLAKQGDPKKVRFPLPMTTSKDFMLSFSGLKTYSRNILEELRVQDGLTKQVIIDFAASFQYAVFRHICYKLNKILQSTEIHEIWLGGGVAANITLRRMIRETARAYTKQVAHPNIPLLVPYTKKLCVDNAAMIGVTAAHYFEHRMFAENLADLDRRPRWSVDEV